MGPDDVAFWGWANVVKGKARDQRQGVAGRRVQDFHSGSWNDFGGFHKILKSAIDCLESDGIAPPNVAKRTEKSVAVAGENDVTKCSRQGRFGDVADGAAQNCVRITLNNDGFQLKTRDLDFANHAAFHQGRRRFCAADIFEFGLFVGLIGVCVHDDVCGIAKSKKANCEKEKRPRAGNGGTPSPRAGCGAVG